MRPVKAPPAGSGLRRSRRRRRPQKSVRPAHSGWRDAAGFFGAQPVSTSETSQVGCDGRCRETQSGMERPLPGSRPAARSHPGSWSQFGKIAPNLILSIPQRQGKAVAAMRRKNAHHVPQNRPAAHLHQLFLREVEPRIRVPCPPQTITTGISSINSSFAALSSNRRRDQDFSGGIITQPIPHRHQRYPSPPHPITSTSV
jgi:hypothetical protein